MAAMDFRYSSHELYGPFPVETNCRSSALTAIEDELQGSYATMTTLIKKMIAS